MATFFALLFLFFLIMLILGLISPKASLFFLKKNKTRKMSLAIYGLLIIFSFIFFAIVNDTPVKNNTVVESENYRDEVSNKTFEMTSSDFLVLLEDLSADNQIDTTILALIKRNSSLCDSILFSSYKEVLIDCRSLEKLELYFIEKPVLDSILKQQSILQNIISYCDENNLNFNNTKGLLLKLKSITVTLQNRYQLYGSSRYTDKMEEAVSSYLFENTPNNRAFKMIEFAPTTKSTKKGFVYYSNYESYNAVNAWVVQNYAQLLLRYNSTENKYEIIEEIKNPDYKLELLK